MKNTLLIFSIVCLFAFASNVHALVVSGTSVATQAALDALTARVDSLERITTSYQLSAMRTQGISNQISTSTIVVYKSNNNMGITGINPTIAKKGTTITIYGVNLNDTLLYYVDYKSGTCNLKSFTTSGCAQIPVSISANNGTYVKFMITDDMRVESIADAYGNVSLYYTMALQNPKLPNKLVWFLVPAN